MNFERNNTRITSGALAAMVLGITGTAAVAQDSNCAVNPVELGVFDTNGSAQKVHVVGSTMFAADGWAGFADPLNPVFMGSAAIVGGAGIHTTDVTVVGNYAYVTDWFSGLFIFDVSDLWNPCLIGVYNTLSGPNGVVVIDSLAYVADGLDGLQIVDVSTPASPTFVGSYNTPGNSEDVAIKGSTAFLADGINGGLQIIDVTDPSAPALLSSNVRPNNTFAIDIAGDILFLADGVTGLSSFDVSDPSFPVLLDLVPAMSTSVWDVVVDGTRAYTAENSTGMRVIDISDPTAMEVLGSYDSAGLNRGIARSGNTTYLCDSGEGIVVLDMEIDCSQGCPVDYNEDGALNFFDVSMYLQLFTSQDAAADLNHDARWNFFDVSEFLSIFSAGCP